MTAAAARTGRRTTTSRTIVLAVVAALVAAATITAGVLVLRPERPTYLDATTTVVQVDGRTLLVAAALPRFEQATPDGSGRRVVALDLATGRAAWETPLPANPASGRVVVLGAGAALVYVADASGPRLLDAATGATIADRSAIPGMEVAAAAHVLAARPDPERERIVIRDEADGLWQLPLADGRATRLEDDDDGAWAAYVAPQAMDWDELTIGSRVLGARDFFLDFPAGPRRLRDALPDDVGRPQSVIARPGVDGIVLDMPESDLVVADSILAAVRTSPCSIASEGSDPNGVRYGSPLPGECTTAIEPVGGEASIVLTGWTNFDRAQGEPLRTELTTIDPISGVTIAETTGRGSVLASFDTPDGRTGVVTSEGDVLLFSRSDPVVQRFAFR